jgi:prepilin-type N-terminal cleavage/methylation domain-containing protein
VTRAIVRYHRVMRSPQRGRGSTGAQRGFTLVEVMAVVIILGILSMVAVMLVRGHMASARTASALAGVKWILSAQTAIRSETGQYWDCSGDSARYYPMLTPSKTLYSWRQEHPDAPRWAALGLPQEGGTRFGYLVNAGLPAAPYPTLQTDEKPAIPRSVDPWYVIQFKGDVDGDGTFMKGIASSVNAEVYVEHEGE